MSRDKRTHVDTNKTVSTAADFSIANGDNFVHIAEQLSVKTENKAIKFSKLTSGLAIAIAALSGYMATSTPAQAAFNIPTDLPASPLCDAVKAQGQSYIKSDGTVNPLCAAEFSAPMLMFEEFGTKDYSTSSNSPSSSHPFPVPSDCNGMAGDPAALATFSDGLDNFLKEDLQSVPTRRTDMSDTGQAITAPNPWTAKVKDCLPATATMPYMPADGRPGGEDFAHQRWDEFYAQRYFQSAQSGARINGGMRDNLQLHKYQKGEFAPGGLYYPTGGTTKGMEIRIHPNLALQSPTSVWTFDGTLPPKLLMARYGEPVLFRHYDALPIASGANAGFGKNTISTHEHNGHNPAESDGFAHAYFYPGQFYDYHWPMALAGHDTINTTATDVRTGAPDGHGGITYLPGDWHETMSTHWFHDHMLDYTAQNVYKGNAAMMNYYSALDRGREPATAAEANGSVAPGYGCNYADANNTNPSANHVNLCFPSGSGLDWGNRDYDVNLLVADKAWDNAGQLKFNIFNTDGFLGDRLTVNWLFKPHLDVRARSYRFRILNGSVSRYYKIAIVRERPLTDTQCKSASSTIILADARPATAITPAEPKKCYEKITYHMIANDGNIMQHAIPFPNAQSPDALPEQGIAERYDIIVNFKGMPVGTKLYMVNILEHTTGATPSRYLRLADVLGSKYKNDGISGDPVVGKFLEFRVKGCGADGISPCTDLSMNPADYVEGKKQMIPLNKPSDTELQAATQRTFKFGKKAFADSQPWTIATDGGTDLNADPHRVSAAPEIGKTEIWHITGGTGGWSHPVHVHFEEGQILYRGGKAPPIWEKYARKDVYRIGGLADSLADIDIAIRFREFAGTYVEHCHNTQHEDKAMLLRWDLQHPGQIDPIQTPMPDWDGVQYDPTIVLATYKTGDDAAKQKFVLPDGTSTASTGASAPTANADTATVVVNQSTVINILANDAANGSALIPGSVLVNNVSNGTVSVDATTGNVTFTAGATAGTGSFDYSVANANGTSSLAHVTVTITPPPIAGAAPTVNADGPFNTAVGGSVAIDVLANDLNNGSALIPSSVVVSNLTLGTASIDAATGRVTFAATASGTGGFDYTVANANGTSTPAHVTVVVAAGDGISISRAQCKSNAWRITGTTTIGTGNSVTFYRTATVPTSPSASNIIGSISVTAATAPATGGTFDFRTTASCTSPISMQSALGAVRNNQAVAN
jgi:FtsP/CotA-like multicopper oxidase with cupredoxin domain